MLQQKTDQPSGTNNEFINRRHFVTLLTFSTPRTQTKYADDHEVVLSSVVAALSLMFMWQIRNCNAAFRWM
jgi:hypothetical protein